jgi:glycosyltransferase involved in cell wall biosynthesis
VTTPEPSPRPAPEATDRLRAIAAEAGLSRIHVLAWRELADPEAGGSELHIHEVMRRWAAAGIEVTIRTSFAPGHPPVDERDGYRIIRRGGRYLLFPRAALSAATGQMGPRDGLVEIWNGVPFLSPIWERGPRVTLLHHVHGPMWKMALGERLGAVGEFMERRIAPRFYRRSRILTLSTSSRDELVHALGFRPERVQIIPPGIDDRFRPATLPLPTPPSPTPLIVAVGRLVPVKRFDMLIRSVTAVHDRHPDLRLVIAGEGYERHQLEDEIARLGATDWISLAGRVDDGELVSLFQRAWIVASASAVEGWGMTLTEAAACGTPAVATRTTGHLDAVVDGVTGLLVDDEDSFADALDTVLSDPARRAAMADAALEFSRRFTWDTTAEAVLTALADEARSTRGSTPPSAPPA